MSSNMTESLEFCRTILPRVSRSFALSINILKGELRLSVLTAYLLCRIVDTIEDLEKDFDISKKASLIDTFIAIFEDEEKLQSFKDEMSLIQISKEYDRVLVLNVDHVFRVFNSLLLKTQKEIKRWVQEMALGMKGFVLKYPKGIPNNMPSNLSNIPPWPGKKFPVSFIFAFLLRNEKNRSPI